MSLFDFGNIKSKIFGNTREDLQRIADAADTELKTGSFASFTKTFATSSGVITIAHKVAGRAGNDWTFQAKDSGGVAGTVTVSTTNKTLYVEIDDTSTTDDVLAGYINNDATAGKIFKATSGSAGAVDSMANAEEFSGAVEQGFTADPTSNYLKSTDFSTRGKSVGIYPSLQILDENIKTSADALAAHIADTSGAHEASAISVADAGSRYTATEVEAALQEIAGSGRTSETVKSIADLINGYKIVSCSIENATNGAASTEVTLVGAVATDVAIAIAADLSNGSATFLKTAVAGTDKVDVTFDANTATGDKFNLLVIRPGS